jgi:hypothetical protein
LSILVHDLKAIRKKESNGNFRTEKTKQKQKTLRTKCMNLTIINSQKRIRGNYPKEFGDEEETRNS